MWKAILVILVMATGVLTAYLLIDDARTNTDSLKEFKKVQPEKPIETPGATQTADETVSATGDLDPSKNANTQSTVPAEAPSAAPTETPSLADNNSNNKPTELEIKTTQEGKGDRMVKSGDKISVLYTGKLLDGTVFDSSEKNGNKPFEFTVGAGGVIKGWDQGLIGAKVKEKRTLTIPSDLGYGAQGSSPSIPPNATLIFDVELVSFIKS